MKITASRQHALDTCPANRPVAYKIKGVFQNPKTGKQYCRAAPGKKAAQKKPAKKTALYARSAASPRFGGTKGQARIAVKKPLVKFLRGPVGMPFGPEFSVRPERKAMMMTFPQQFSPSPSPYVPYVNPATLKPKARKLRYMM